MSGTLAALVDVDDLIHEDQIEEHLVPLHDAVSRLIVTAYAIPNKLGPVHALRERYPWIRFGIHGWEHTFCECLGWTDADVRYYVQRALEMGYHPMFKPPNWEMYQDLEPPFVELGVVLHRHDRYKAAQPGLRVYCGTKAQQKPPHTYIHTHIVKSPVTDFIKGHPQFAISNLSMFSRFFEPTEVAETIE